MGQAETTAQITAARINESFSPGGSFASAFYGWAGTPWRPGDTDVSLIRCWAEGDVLCIETSLPYQEEGSMQLRIYHPSGAIIVTKQRLSIESASKVVLNGVESLPREGLAFETS
jgi:hypothetical protein